MATHHQSGIDLFYVEAEMVSTLHDMSDEELRCFIELQGDPANDDQIELYIYTCFLDFTRTGSTENLEHAIQRMEGWIAELATDHPDRTRRFRIFDMMWACMCQLSLILEDVEDTRSTNSHESVYDEIDLRIDQAARLATEYERTGSMSDLSEAIHIIEEAINIMPKPSALENLGCLLSSRFEQTGSMDDLNRAVELADMAVDATPQVHPDRASRLNSLGALLGTRFKRTGSVGDLNRAIEVADIAVDTTPQDHPDRAGHLNNLGNLLGSRFERTSSIDDLNRAVELADMAVDAIPQDHPFRAACLNGLGTWLGSRFKRTGSMDDLSRAVEVADIAVGATPQDHPDRAGYLNNLGNLLGSRFERTGSVDDLNRAVEVADIAVDASSQDHPDRAALLGNLGIWLGTRFRRTGSIDDLNRAIEIADIAVDATIQDHPGRAALLSTLGNLLGSRFERTGSIDDLNRAVEVVDLAVGAIPQDHPDRASHLNNLGKLLRSRFERTGSMDDLNRAVEVVDMAVDATPQDHPDRTSRLNTLGNLYGSRFERTGLVDDLNRAIEVADIAVGATPQDHPDRAGLFSNLGIRLGRRFERTGSVDDLNYAVEIADMAVGATPQDHPSRAGGLNNLGNLLGSRFERTGSVDDLNRAVEVVDMAVDATPQDHPDRAGRLNNLGNLLGVRFKRTGSIDDLNRAIEIADIAVGATPQDHPDRAGRLNNLGNLLGSRFERTGSVDDLNRAVEVMDMAVDATPQDHPDRGGRLNTLGFLFGSRSKLTGSMDDLNRAVEVVDKAVDAIPQDHPFRAYLLSNLGDWLGSRFKRTDSMDDLNRQLSSYKEGWSCSTALPSIRIRLAWQAAHILTSQLNWEESSTLLEEAVNLLPTVSPRSLKNTDKQHMLAAFAGLASMSAATALNAGKGPHHALRFLELGRGIIAGLLMELRGDISDLQQQYPDLADEFMSLRDELDLPDEKASLILGDSSASWESQTKRRREADQKFGELVIRVRAQPGFHNFLLPPTVDELMAAADPDPIIVVNLSSYRCDAFLIDRSRIRLLELPDLTMKDVQKRTLDLRTSRLGASPHLSSLLRWLWDVIARPSLEALGLKNPVSGDNWPRVWWVATGVLSQFPLHAAGYHTQGSTETVLDRAMSSYASSVKVLIHERRYHVRKIAGPRSDRGLLVAMRETPGLSTNELLPFAIAEVEMLKDLCPSLQLTPVTPTLRKDDVLKQLEACRIFHFAGHGRSDPVEPSQSCLLLEDWKTNPLTVGDFRDHRLQQNPPFLGYLSACSTGANEADRLADEGIHLVSALQLAGFRHVVGTLWEVSDKHCVDVARVLYETLRDEGMTDIAVCRGLHRAIRALRDGRIEKGEEARKAFCLESGGLEKGLMNGYWIPYVHFGV